MSASCCPPPSADGAEKKSRADWLLRCGLGVTGAAYLVHLLVPEVVAGVPYVGVFAESIHELFNRMWWGLVLALLIVGGIASLPDGVPVAGLIGRPGSFGGILRAVVIGVLLDVCSHGVLIIGLQLYRRGASLGQTMAFLIASPWNSLSLTLILISLVGLPWMLALLVLSMVIAVVSGVVFEKLVARGVLPGNPNSPDSGEKESNGARELWRQVGGSVRRISLRPRAVWGFLRRAWGGSTMVLRWIFLGLVIAAAVRALVDPESFRYLFGPTVRGVGLTLLVATILEVCSEGSTPIAADILTRAGAPGNSFVFLMAGVSTDYTEIAGIRETTKSWKIALFLPLVTLPQIIGIGVLLNQVSL